MCVGGMGVVNGCAPVPVLVFSCLFGTRERQEGREKGQRILATA